MYGIKNSYEITPNTEAADFLEHQVKEHFGYVSKSKREKYADVWMDGGRTGLNVKTDNLCGQVQGRLCTAEVNQWLRDEENNLKFLFVRYRNDGSGILTVESIKEVFIEEIVYQIMNQGRGLLQPKRDKHGEVVLRERITRQEWIEEFKIKYAEFVDKQVDRFQKYKKNWC